MLAFVQAEVQRLCGENGVILQRHGVPYHDLLLLGNGIVAQAVLGDAAGILPQPGQPDAAGFLKGHFAVQAQGNGAFGVVAFVANIGDLHHKAGFLGKVYLPADGTAGETHGFLAHVVIFGQGFAGQLAGGHRKLHALRQEGHLAVGIVVRKILRCGRYGTCGLSGLRRRGGNRQTGHCQHQQGQKSAQDSFRVFHRFGHRLCHLFTSHAAFDTPWGSNP